MHTHSFVVVSNDDTHSVAHNDVVSDDDKMTMIT